MNTAERTGRWVAAIRRRLAPQSSPPESPPAPPPKIGLALGGGFARGIAHAGVLRVFEDRGIPIHCIAGISAGAIVAAAWASGADAREVGRAGCAMRFADVARWSVRRLGFVGSERMVSFLRRLLRCQRFEEMHTRLGVLATDLSSGEPVVFRDQGDVILPIRASCSYPGLFHPVRLENRLLVDGAMSMEVPAQLCRQMGASHVISVHLPVHAEGALPSNMFQVVNRCFQIMQTHAEATWRPHSNLILAPDVRGLAWDAFGFGQQMIEAGEKAALEALPAIQGWFPKPATAAGQLPLPDSVPA